MINLRKVEAGDILIGLKDKQIYMVRSNDNDFIRLSRINITRTKLGEGISYHIAAYALDEDKVYSKKCCIEDIYELLLDVRERVYPEGRQMMKFVNLLLGGSQSITSVDLMSLAIWYVSLKDMYKVIERAKVLGFEAPPVREEKPAPAPEQPKYELGNLVRKAEFTIEVDGYEMIVKTDFIKNVKVICGDYSASAHCHKLDKFDLNVGFNLALERLYDKFAEDEETAEDEDELEEVGFVTCVQTNVSEFKAGEIYPVYQRCSDGVWTLTTDCSIILEPDERSDFIFYASALKTGDIATFCYIDME